jgi:isoleucyl-tRNA synthetase
VWGTRFPEAGSVHLLEWPEMFPGEGRGPGKREPLQGSGLDPGLRRGTDWAELRALRAKVTEAIEPLRRDKVIGSSLEAEVTVPSDADREFLQELFITSTVHQGDWKVVPTDNHKCGRCWRHLPEVTSDGDLCDRCNEVVNG